MATGGEDNVPQHIQRLSDIDIELAEMLIPIDGYEDMPLVPLDIAVEPLICSVPVIRVYAYSTTEQCKKPPADGLTIDESASIMLYSMDWKPADKSLYLVLNAALKSADTIKLEPWFLYLKLFFTALSRFTSTHRQVYRGIKLDLSKQYPVGETIVWAGFSFCTTSINVLQSESVLGTTGTRTMFSINCHSGKDIEKHYYGSSENEIFLLPPTSFRVSGYLNQGGGLHIVYLEEIQPCYSRLHEPIFSSISNKLSSNIGSTSNSIVNHHTKWKQVGVQITGSYGEHSRHDCLYFPCGIFVDDDDDQTIYVADFGKHRIMSWKYGSTTGRLVAGGNGSGDNLNQLNQPLNVVVDRRRNHVFINDLKNRRIVRWSCENGTHGEIIISNIHCRGLAIDNNGDLYVSNAHNNEVQRWKVGNSNGTLVAGGNGEGDRLNQLYFPTSLVVDDDHSLYILDLGNRRIVKWMKGAKEGIFVAGGGLTQLSSPNGLVVDHLGTVYTCDWKDHRILRWCKGATQWDIIISKLQGRYEEGQLENPKDLAMDRQGNLYVTKYYSHQALRFDIDQN